MFKDLAYGLEKENGVYDQILQYFPNLEKTNLYCHWDYENEDSIIELKSRRVSKAYYPDTMIGMIKINKMLDNDKNAYALFNFTDGLYYYPINNQSVSVCRICDGGRIDRGSYEINRYMYIPNSLLKKINELDNEVE